MTSSARARQPQGAVPIWTLTFALVSAGLIAVGLAYYHAVRNEILAEARYRAVVVLLGTGLLILLTGGGTAYGASRRRAAARRKADEEIRKLSQAVEQSPVSVVVTDLAGTIEYVNRAFTVITGYPAAEALGKNPRILKSGAQGPAFYRRMWGTLLSGAVWQGEVVNRRKDGALYTQELVIAPVRDAEDRLVRFVGIGHDVTQVKRAERDLQDALAFNANILAAAPVGIVTYRLTGECVSCNAAAARIVGATVEQLQGQNFRTLESWKRSGLLDLAERAITTREPQAADSHILTTFGKDLWCAARTAVFRSGDEDLLLLTLADITERKRTEAALRQSEKLAAMGELLAGVAHELNNPLSVILGHAHLLARAAAGPPVAARAEKIAGAAEVCARIVRNFLALARQSPPERHTVSLNGIIQGAMELVAYQLRVDNVQVTLDLDNDLPDLWADSQQLQQVVVNLVTNAHHALRETPPPRQLTIATRTDAGRSNVFLEVADTGPGIPAAIQGRIFEPFFTTKPLGQGTGLGLPLSQSHVEAHGGHIRLESQPEHGATFRVDLPVQAAPVIAPDAAPASRPPAGSAMTILLVDDDPEVRSVLGETLSADGHRVDTATDGVHALSRLAEGAYDAVLTDIRMPELDGPGLYREIARLYPHLVRSVVFITGDALSLPTREFLAQTVAPRIEKPFDVTAIRRALGQLKRPPGASSRG